MGCDTDSLQRKVDRAVERVDGGAGEWPDAILDDAVTPEERLAALLVMLGRPLGEWGRLALSPEERRLFDSLRRRALPWDADHAAFALDTMLTTSWDHERTGIALRGAEAAIANGSTDARLHDALHRVAERLEALTVESAPLGIFGLEPARRRARRLLAGMLPAGVLDLSFLAEGDNWAEPAREAARRTPTEEVESLLRLLRELGHRAAPKRWGDSVREMLTHEEPREVLIEWIRLATETPETDDPAPNAPPVRLFAPGNDDVVRAAVLAAGFLPAASAIPAPLLGTLALRGAETRPGTADPLTSVLLTRPGSPESLALKVAGAAIDTLGQRGGPDDRAELTRLLETLTRRDLVKRVGARLGEDGVARAEARDRELKRSKAAAVRAHGDPAPRRARAELDKRLRTDVGRTLRDLGFRSTGRIWRRFHPTHVDVMRIGPDGSGFSVAYLGGAPYVVRAADAPENRLEIQYGVSFDAINPSEPPYSVRNRDLVVATGADLTMKEHGWPDEPVSLALLADRLRHVIVPFLDDLGRRESLAAVLDGRTPLPLSADGQPLHLAGGPPPDLLLGALALEAGDLSEARRLITRWIETSAERYPDDECEGLRRDYWRRRLTTGPTST